MTDEQPDGLIDLLAVSFLPKDLKILNLSHRLF